MIFCLTSPTTQEQLVLRDKTDKFMFSLYVGIKINDNCVVFCVTALLSNNRFTLLIIVYYNLVMV